MRIVGVEALVFGVEDIAECVRCCQDFGLDLVPSSAASAPVLTALDGSSVQIKRLDDPSLPAIDIPGPTLRQVIWGVQDSETLDLIAAELGKDRDTALVDGLLQTRDDNGVAIAFRLATKQSQAEPLPAANVPGHFQRPVNERVEFAQRVRPRGIAHVVFDCADEPKARAFYVERLGFIVSDSFRNTGAFLRTSIAREHHSVFTVQKEKSGLNHVAFYVTDFHEVMLGGMRMSEKGWETHWGPGRHKLGSNYFWYFKSPLGGQLEFTCDVDHVDENWVPRELEFSRENSAMWSATGVIPTKLPPLEHV
ncbi:VOC family protein [Novosphingobium sp. BL-52-GroH]|uniref:VOC family protein n=1 Tax=Novosphingobium sp. BL-52-GroH TaxID=3349877 RepID=UPI00384CA8FA